MSSKLLFKGTDWDIPLLERIWDTVLKVNDEVFKFDIYPVETHLVNVEQMLANESAMGMLPIIYSHWSWGKQAIQNEAAYKAGQKGLAYECILNTNPAIMYIMDTNTAAMQATVMCHAGIGHNAFFKNNYVFKNAGQTDSIMAYLEYAANYIAKCEQMYGQIAVEQFLTEVHTLRNVGFFRYPRKEVSYAEEQRRGREYIEALEKDSSIFDSITPDLVQSQRDKVQHYSNLLKQEKSSVILPEENILYFIEKNSQVLKIWQREIIRIVRIIQQYFYPNYQTKVINEGFATFVHHEMMTELEDQGYIDSGAYLEFIKSHSGVCNCQDNHSTFFINPYALGYKIFRNIKKVCQGKDLTSYEKENFKEIIGTPWLDTIKWVMENFRDESFILQFFTPELAKELRLYELYSDKNSDYMEVVRDSSKEDFESLKRTLADQYVLEHWYPMIEVTEYAKSLAGSMFLGLTYQPLNKQELTEGHEEMRLIVAKLMGVPTKFTVNRSK